MDVLELCKKYRHDGVVAIDLAGDESLNCEANPEHRKAYEVSSAKHRHDKQINGTLNDLWLTVKPCKPGSHHPAATTQRCVIKHLYSHRVHLVLPAATAKINMAAVFRTINFQVSWEYFKLYFTATSFVGW